MAHWKALEPNQEMQEQYDFIINYEQLHYSDGCDPVQLRSDALTAYHDFKGYKFGDDEDSFILPK